MDKSWPTIPQGPSWFNIVASDRPTGSHHPPIPQRSSRSDR
ncbi:MAG: hypothetical protein WBA43_00350 [Elainellaceae cyanobacterium]